MRKAHCIVKLDSAASARASRAAGSKSLFSSPGPESATNAALLAEFTNKYRSTHAGALREIRSGRKSGCWSWWIWPTSFLPGSSGRSAEFALSDSATEQFIAEPYLRSCWVEMMSAVAEQLAHGVPVGTLCGVDAPRVPATCKLFGRVANMPSNVPGAASTGAGRVSGGRVSAGVRDAEIAAVCARVQLALDAPPQHTMRAGGGLHPARLLSAVPSLPKQPSRGTASPKVETTASAASAAAASSTASAAQGTGTGGSMGGGGGGGGYFSGVRMVCVKRGWTAHRWAAPVHVSPVLVGRLYRCTLPCGWLWPLALDSYDCIGSDNTGNVEHVCARTHSQLNIFSKRVSAHGGTCDILEPEVRVRRSEPAVPAV